MYRLIPRSEWGARYDNGTGSRRLPATQAWLHHSAGVAPDLVAPYHDDYTVIRTLERIGEDRFGAGISYTRLITPAGLVFEGHSIDRIGTHTGGRNSVAVGYCLVGNYETMYPTLAMLKALVWCLQEDHRQGWLDAPRLDGGHRDLKQTACPGQHAYVLIGDVNRRAAGPPVYQDMEDFMAALTEDQQQQVYAVLADAYEGTGVSIGNQVKAIYQALDLLKAIYQALKVPTDPTRESWGVLANRLTSVHQQVFRGSGEDVSSEPAYGPPINTQLTELRSELAELRGLIESRHPEGGTS